MNEKQLLTDIFDLINGNTDYIAPETFRKRYDKYFVELDLDSLCIHFADEHKEYTLNLHQTFWDGQQDDNKNK